MAKITGAPNAIDMLTQDHQNVQKLFKDFKKFTDGKGIDEKKSELVSLACAALTVHARIEEEIFYPAVRDILEAKDLLDEATVEHISAKALIAQLAEMKPGDALYDATFTVLGEYVNHHIEEEQDELFPKVRQAKLDLEELGRQLQERAETILLEMGFTTAKKASAQVH